MRLRRWRTVLAVAVVGLVIGLVDVGTGGVGRGPIDGQEPRVGDVQRDRLDASLLTPELSPTR